MFESTSRYASLQTATHTSVDGRQIAFVRRRFLPQAKNLPLLAEVTVIEGERLDLITARTLGDPEQFWRVADTNNAMNPFDLTDHPGQTVRVSVPQVQA